jgi:hypothetical protein
MFDIAGGIVLGFAAICLVFVLFLIAASILRRIGGDLVWIAVAIAGAAALQLGAAAVYVLLEALGHVFGPAAEDAGWGIFSMLLLGSVVFFFVDSLQEFAWTGGAFRWLWKWSKPLTWRCWLRKYRLVDENNGAVGYAPYLWIARCWTRVRPVQRSPAKLSKDANYRLGRG